MDQKHDTSYFPIRFVSEQTGVNSVTLRAWERRYGLIKPLRTPKGHRLYTREHIELINHICDMLNSGISISKIASRLLESEKQASHEDHDTWQRYQERMLECICQFDERGLDLIYNEANSIYPVDVVTNRLIVPLLHEIGRRWSAADGSVAEEHFFSVYLRNKIGARLHHQNTLNTGKRLVIASLPGELHEFGILLFALSANSRGYRTVVLGSDLPLSDLPRVIEVTGCDGLVLAGSANLECSKLEQELLALVDSVTVPVFIGGDAVEQCVGVIERSSLHAIGRDITSGIARIRNIINKRESAR